MRKCIERYSRMLEAEMCVWIVLFSIFSILLTPMTIIYNWPIIVIQYDIVAICLSFVFGAYCAVSLGLIRSIRSDARIMLADEVGFRTLRAVKAMGRPRNLFFSVRFWWNWKKADGGYCGVPVNVVLEENHFVAFSGDKSMKFGSFVNAMCWAFRSQ